MALNANVLVSLAEFKIWLGIGSSDTGTDSRNEAAINAASQDIESECRRKFITPSADLTEIFAGDGTREMYSINRPITTVTSIKYRDGVTGSTWTSVTGNWIYTIDTDAGRIYFTDGNIFSSGWDNWQINYKYGYAIANVPTDLKMACLILAAMAKKRFENELFGINSKSFGETSITYSIDQMPDDVKRILNRYKRVVLAV